MHIYFSGIGGTGIGPLAIIAHQAGYTVSGSDKRRSQYTDYVHKHGIEVRIGQTYEQIAAEHAINPIDWLVYSSAVPLEQPNHPELVFARDNNIRLSKRDDCLNSILTDKKLSMIAAAGTHGKTTATAMLVWLFKYLELPLSYSVGAKIGFGDMGSYQDNSTYFAYECDEFDRNFLQFNPSISLIASVDWDHHEIYKTREEYKQAFRDFIKQSKHTFIYRRDADYLGLSENSSLTIIDDNDTTIQQIKLTGLHNRQNARIVIAGAAYALNISESSLIEGMSRYPGSSRRFEKIAPNLYSDYAHTPEEIAATLQLAHELSDKVIAIYEPLTDRRQHYAKEQYYNVFENTNAVYWLPSYLAREDSSQAELTPGDLISYLSHKTRAFTAEKNEDLKEIIDSHLKDGALVVCIAGGGGESLDEWVRQAYAKPA